MLSPELEASYKDWKPDLLLPDDFIFFKSIVGEVRTPVGDVFTVPEVSEQMFGSAAKFWFSPEFIEACQPTSNFMAGCSFEEKPEWRETRLNSRRQAFFGKLILDFGDYQVTEDVACKHFYGAPEEALHEYLASEYVNNLRLMKAFDPIGIWFDPNGTAFLLTRFEKDVVSFDNIDWNHNPDDSVREHFDILSALELVAHSGARYAANDLAHNDFLAKNAGIDKATGSIRAIDLEQMRIVHTQKDPNLELMFENMKTDMLSFMASIHDAGFRWGEEPELRSQIIRSTFLSSYRSALRHPSTLGRQKYGQEFSDRLEDMCEYLESLTTEQIQEYWEMLLKSAEAGNEQISAFSTHA